ncbi:pyridoxal 5'-phosphate synthase glutaminase subunit PdxT [Clostridium tunisiense]|uniref:pyridoxal 5'-phosphate synthase glutaminase subunit PdxT n=1 Tax=Clostridium tunisiense TaxID=219748 RepID=UPI000312038B|nr:pyridoxal 5'-phosphate synthase glutaminase subunit PdxT [Clostridium tunisiense]
MITIGVLGIQGAVSEHIDKLRSFNEVKAIVVKTKEELNLVQGIIIPGGESTAIGKLLEDFSLIEPLRERIEKGLPVWGTCAGMILLAKKISKDPKAYLKVMNIEVKRNAYGSQLESFQEQKIIKEISKEPIPIVFIRAPYVERIWGTVDILAEVDGKIVACREKNMLATSFHPELTEDLSFHKYFVEMIS